MSSQSYLSVAVRRCCAVFTLPCVVGVLGGGLVTGCIENVSTADESSDINSATEPRFYDNEDGTVADAKTWLTWQQKAAPGMYTLEEAKSYCAELELAGGGWELPTLPKLESLVDTSYFPTIDPIAFPDTPEEWAWTASSSPFVGPSGDAWVVSFTNGASINITETSKSFSVRCVR